MVAMIIIYNNEIWKIDVLNIRLKLKYKTHLKLSWFIWKEHQTYVCKYTYVDKKRNHLLYQI